MFNHEIRAIETKNKFVAKGIKKKRRTESNTDQRTRTVTFEPIEGHQYSEFVVRLSSLLYSRVNCGFRSVVEILNIINEAFDGLLGKIPCYNTVENWVKKCGLNAYETAGDTFQGTDYAEVVDESMMIGSEKLLLTLGVPAEHKGNPLDYSDVQVLDIAVSDSWNGERIGEQLKKASEKVGHEPLYVISDNASTMNKGIRCAGMQQHRDISHSVGIYLERAYKEEADFKEYTKLMTESKFKHNMKKIAYLLPPTQRTISRFLNLSDWVKWSSNMLNVYHTFNKEERDAFSFIPKNASLIDELAQVMQCINSIEHICKCQGFSNDTVSQCIKEVRRILMCGNARMINLGFELMKYLQKEATILQSKDAVHNNSSDIIESLFGKYKARKSENKLNGVTPFVLLVPFQVRTANAEQAKSFDFKAALENTKLREIDDWKTKNLTPNLSTLRTNRLKNAV